MTTLRFLCIGDIVGRPGRNAVAHYITDLQRDFKIDFTLANIENAAGGFGFTADVYHELLRMGINSFTSGNHVFEQKDILDHFDRFEHLTRPLNYPPGTPGSGYRFYTVNGVRIAIVNLIGRVFIGNFDCPFRAIDALIPEFKSNSDIIIVDVHAETTSEKNALGWYLDGRVSCVFGTHTHVMTADERLLPQGTAFITDIGMCGARDTVIGMLKEPVIKRFLSATPVRFNVPKTGPFFLNAIVVTVDKATGHATGIERIVRGC